MEKKRIVWIELLRIAACVGVLGIHAGSQHFRDMPVDSAVWQVSNFYHGINRFAVACFIMISGSLYLSSKRTWDLKKLWQRNILPVASAYIFWQLFYGFYRIAVNGGPKIGSMEFLKKMLVYVSKPYFHLWYLPMLIGLLIITPLVWEIVNSSRGKQWSQYMILLFLVFQIFTYTAGRFNLPWKEHVQSLMNTVHPELVTGYIGYFVLGHYLYEYGLPKKLEKTICILGPVLILAGIWLCRKESLRKGQQPRRFMRTIHFLSSCGARRFFCFLKNRCQR